MKTKNVIARSRKAATKQSPSKIEDGFVAMTTQEVTR